jgi:hypothetical protein
MVQHAPHSPAPNACQPGRCHLLPLEASPATNTRALPLPPIHTHLAAGDAEWPQVPEDEVVVGAASHQVEPVVDQPRSQRTAVGNNLRQAHGRSARGCKGVSAGRADAVSCRS